MARITEQAKQATRMRIINSACDLFKDKGFEQATTRDIAQSAGIATGTLFNYFPTKEEIVMELMATGLEQAADDFAKQQRAEASLEEDLFLHVATGLRRMKVHRKYLGRALETTLSPLSSISQQAEAIRVAHLETVEQTIARHELSLAAWTVPMQLYWTLYTGVLAYWVNDASPKQEDSLAMLDQSIAMFVSWLREQASS